jgi:hypothetical protein
MSGERKRRKQCQEMGLKKEQSDKEMRLEERGERFEADLAKGEGWTLAGTTMRYYLSVGNARKCFAHHRAFWTYILTTAVYSEVIE